MSMHIETRKKLKSIVEISSFNALLDSIILTETEKQMMKMHYLEGKNFCLIGDLLGYTKSGIKNMHRKILNKINKLL